MERVFNGDHLRILVQERIVNELARQFLEEHSTKLLSEIDMEAVSKLIIGLTAQRMAETMQLVKK